MKPHRLICLLVLATHLGGCSMLFVDGPRPKEPRDNREPAACSTSYAAPIVDTVVMGLAIVGAAYWASRSDEQARDQGTTPGAEMGIRLGIAGLTAASSFIGFNRVAACRESHEPAQPTQRLSRAALAPQPMVWTAQGVVPGS